MASTNKYYAVGSGKVYIAPRDSTGITGAFTWMGDVDGFEITGSQQFLDFYESYSGNRARVVHIPTSTELGFTMAVRNIDGDNLVKAFYGTQSSAVGASVTGQAHNAYAGGTIMLAHPGVSAVTVTKTAGSVALVAGVDYVLDAAGGTITFLAGSTNVTGASAVPVTVNYTHGGYTSKIEFLADTSKDYALRFVGRSAVDGKAQVYQIHRANFSLAASLQLIGEDVGVLNLEGACLAAPEIVTGSPFLTAIQA